MNETTIRDLKGILAGKNDDTVIEYIVAEVPSGKVVCIHVQHLAGAIIKALRLFKK